MKTDIENAAIAAAFSALRDDDRAGAHVTGEADELIRVDGWINVPRLVQAISEVLGR